MQSRILHLTSVHKLPGPEVRPHGWESGVWKPQGGSLSAPTRPLHMGLASGRVVAEIPVLSFPPLRRGDGSIHGACVLPERVSGLSLTLRCGVVWAATQQVLRCGPALGSPSRPGGQEPLLSCLPRLDPKWNGLLGCEGERFQQQLPPPLLWGTATVMGQ